MVRQILGGVLLFFVGVLVGRALPAGPGEAAPVLPAAATGGAPPLPSAPAGGRLSGRVAEVLQVPQYTYLRFETGEWAAVSAVPSLKAGDDVTVSPQQQMVDFKSPSLGRTFSSLWFGTLESGTVVSPLPSDGLRVADVYGRRAELSGKSVRLRGTVDRVNLVQGVHYLHLKDGSGDSSAGTDDLLCIASESPERGAVVTLEGVVVLDKDVGMGPRPVVLDRARVSR